MTVRLSVAAALLLCLSLLALSPAPAAAATTACFAGSDSCFGKTYSIQGASYCCGMNSTRAFADGNGVVTCDGNFPCSPAYNVPTSSTGSSDGGSTGSAGPSGSGSSVSCSCCVGEGCTKQFVGTVTTSQTCKDASLRALCSQRYPSKCPADSTGVGAACEAIADGVVDPSDSALLFVASYTDSSCSTLHGRRFYLKNFCFETAPEFTKFNCTQWAWSVSDYAETDSTCGGASLASASGEGPETCAPYKKADGTLLGYVRVDCSGEIISAANSAAAASLIMAAVIAAAVALFSRA